MSRPSDARPPSPPHSTDGDHFEHSHPPPGHAPYTPPVNNLPLAGMEPSYDQYGDPALYQNNSAHQSYYLYPPQEYRPFPSRHYSPSPTPYEGMQTRSGRAVRSPESATSRRRAASPRKRPPRRKAGKANKGGPVIDQPLSILTEGYEVPVRDMEKWATRSVDVRMEEVAKKNGYVSRPMNSFMLYRSAYAERVKRFCKENNHQVVSQVTGASWPLESDEIRKKYEKLALLERDNHQAAHPEYKFAPNKSGKKRGRDEDDSDSDGEWGGRGKRSRTAGSVRRDDTRSSTATPFEGDRWGYASPGPYAPYGYQNPSSYTYQYPDRPMPMYPDSRHVHGQYWQQQVRQHGAPGYVEDVHFSKAEHGFPVQDNMLSMVGLPNADGQHLLADTGAEAMLDPRLGGMESNFAIPSVEGAPRASYPQEAFHPGNATLSGYEAGSDFDREFQQFRD